MEQYLQSRTFLQLYFMMMLSHTLSKNFYSLDVTIVLVSMILWSVVQLHFELNVFVISAC